MTKRKFGDGIDIDRRSLLKSIGAAGAASGLAAAAGSAAAETLTGDAKRERAAELLSAAPTDAFENRFGSLGARPDESQVEVVATDGRQAAQATVPTKFGPLQVAELAGDETLRFAALDLADARADRLGDPYANAPDGTRPLLVASSNSDGLSFRRDATDAEKRLLAAATDRSADTLQATLESDIGGFGVTDAEMDTGEYVAVELDELRLAEATASDIENATVSKKVSASADCLSSCDLCLEKAEDCNNCCTNISLNCISCIIYECGITAAICLTCYNCLN